MENGENGELTLGLWHERLEKTFKDTPREAARYYNIQMLPRLMRRLSEQSGECSNCLEKVKTLENVIEKVPGWINSNASEMLIYEKEVSDSLSHLASSHGVYPKGIWLSRIIVIALVSGIVAAFIMHLLTRAGDLTGFLILGASLGMVTGWGSGKFFERTLRKRNRLF